MTKSTAMLVLDHQPGREPPGTSLVVGFDRRPESLAALRTAIQIGRRLQAGLWIVHAVDLSDYPVDPDRHDYEEQAQKTLAEERVAVSTVLAGYEFGWSYRALNDDPVHALIRTADDIDALMIVVGSRGEGWHLFLERLVSPSVSHRLIERCGRPVLVVSHTRSGSNDAPL
jgi:nucleotide-binding universal stress UspA family protein